MEEHYIQKNIRAISARKLIAPLLFLALLLILWSRFSFADFLFPYEFDGSTPAEEYAEKDAIYVEASADILYYTGLTCSRMNKTVGYFYYRKCNDTYLFYLLDPAECSNGKAELNDVIIKGKIVEGGSDYQVLLTAMAETLGWTYSGISESSGAYYISQPDYNYGISMLVLVLITLGALYSLVYIIVYVLNFIFPYLSWAILRLRRYGNAKKLLEQAEEELSTLPQLATEDMFITEHFFIEVSSYGVALIPISEIVWLYKHSTFKQIGRHNMKLSYTLRIYGKHRVNFNCPKNTKSDIDGIMDYLAEANHDIMVGFSQEHMKKAKDLSAL